MEWGPIITGLLSIVALIFKWWLDSAPKRDQEAADEATQQGRADIADGNSDAVNDRIDRLLSGQSDTEGQHGTEDLSGRIADLTGASILPGTGNNGANTGASGSVQETNK